MAMEATRMLARAFVTNPLHVAAFGPGQIASIPAANRHEIVKKVPFLSPPSGAASADLIGR
jgi:hypothetical protein